MDTCQCTPVGAGQPRVEIRLTTVYLFLSRFLLVQRPTSVDPNSANELQGMEAITSPNLDLLHNWPKQDLLPIRSSITFLSTDPPQTIIFQLWPKTQMVHCPSSSDWLTQSLVLYWQKHYSCMYNFVCLYTNRTPCLPPLSGLSVED